MRGAYLPGKSFDRSFIVSIGRMALRFQPDVEEPLTFVDIKAGTQVLISSSLAKTPNTIPLNSPLIPPLLSSLSIQIRSQQLLFASLRQAFLVRHHPEMPSCILRRLLER